MCFSSFSVVFFFKRKASFELRICDWSSDVCASDLVEKTPLFSVGIGLRLRDDEVEQLVIFDPARNAVVAFADVEQDRVVRFQALGAMEGKARDLAVREPRYLSAAGIQQVITPRSEEHTSELQSLMSISYAVFCLN